MTITSQSLSGDASTVPLYKNFKKVSTAKLEKSLMTTWQNAKQAEVGHVSSTAMGVSPSDMWIPKYVGSHDF